MDRYCVDQKTKESILQSSPMQSRLQGEARGWSSPFLRPLERTNAGVAGQPIAGSKMPGPKSL